MGWLGLYRLESVGACHNRKVDTDMCTISARDVQLYYIVQTNIEVYPQGTPQQAKYLTTSYCSYHIDI